MSLFHETGTQAGYIIIFKVVYIRIAFQVFCYSNVSGCFPSRQLCLMNAYHPVQLFSEVSKILTVRRDVQKQCRTPDGGLWAKKGRSAGVCKVYGCNFVLSYLSDVIEFYLWHVFCFIIKYYNIGVTHGYGSVHSRNLSAGLFAAISSVIYAWRRADNKWDDSGI